MSLRFLAAPALIAAAFAPAVSQAQQSQITIQTQATIMVSPDRGTVPVIVTAHGDTEREARANLELNDRETRKALTAKGFRPGQISILATSTPEITEQKDFEACAAAYAEPAKNDPAIAHADAAAAAAKEAADAEFATDCQEKVYLAKRQLLVQIEGPAQEQALAEAERTGELQFGKATWSQSDPAAAKQRARDAAMAQARQEADVIAASLGYRITGISRVSTATAPMTTDGLIRFIMEIDGPGRKRGPEWFGTRISETVTIDFIAVPK